MGKLTFTPNPRAFSLPEPIDHIWTVVLPQNAVARTPDVTVREWRKGQWQYAPFTGYYDGSIELLALQDNKGGKQAFLSVACHELGHHLYNYALSDAQQLLWQSWWRQHQDKLPTQYAHKNAFEGFGECVEWTYRAPNPGDRIAPAAAAMVKQLLNDMR